jgi:RNA polymerase sigma factor (sigma-70 family)
VSSSRQHQRTDLAALLAGATAGDHDAWREIIARYAGLVRWVCRKHRLTSEETEDVMQTAWMRLFTHGHSLRDPSAITGWLVTTVTRECSALQRRKRREMPEGRAWQEVDDLADPDAHLDEVDDRLDAVTRRRQLRDAVASLPRREQDLVTLMMSGDRISYADISKRLAMPTGAIGPVRQRALRRLRSCLEAQAIVGE